MQNLKYCQSCILPNTRPNLFTNKSSVMCSVCSTIKKRKRSTNWAARKKEFIKVIKKIKKNNSIYDCLIPVSGGKDSTWQVITALKYKLNPLCITWRSPSRNSIGQKNLNNLIKLGVDHIDFSINDKVEKYFTLKAFKNFGNPLIPMHMAMHAITIRTAIEKKIKLVLWGENSADEYGGVNKLKGKKMTNLWRNFYGMNYGKKINYWFDKKLNIKNTYSYNLPSENEIRKHKIDELFLGYFFKWDPIKIFNISKRKGFKNIQKPKTGYYNFADIDDEFLITIHHHLKWYKYGFTRLWDNLSIEIRNGRISRKKAISIIKRNGSKLAPTREINLFCKYLGISKSNFFSICDKLRNKNIWKKNNQKKWQIKNFLIKDFNWN